MKTHTTDAPVVMDLCGDSQFFTNLNISDVQRRNPLAFTIDDDNSGRVSILRSTLALKNTRAADLTFWSNAGLLQAVAELINKELLVEDS